MKRAYSSIHSHDQDKREVIPKHSKRRRRGITRSRPSSRSIKVTIGRREQIPYIQPMAKLRVLSCGFIRSLAARLINPNDIAHIVSLYLSFDDWKFKYCHDYQNVNYQQHGVTTHGIENSGKSLKCNGDCYCCCFYTNFSMGMNPYSGKYCMKIRVNNIDSRFDGYCFGIIAENF